MGSNAANLSGALQSRFATSFEYEPKRQKNMEQGVTPVGAPRERYRRTTARSPTVDRRGVTDRARRPGDSERTEQVKLFIPGTDVQMFGANHLLV